MEGCIALCATCCQRHCLQTVSQVHRLQLQSQTPSGKTQTRARDGHSTVTYHGRVYSPQFEGDDV